MRMQGVEGPRTKARAGVISTLRMSQEKASIGCLMDDFIEPCALKLCYRLFHSVLELLEGAERQTMARYPFRTFLSLTADILSVEAISACTPKLYLVLSRVGADQRSRGQDDQKQSTSEVFRTMHAVRAKIEGNRGSCFGCASEPALARSESSGLVAKELSARIRIRRRSTLHTFASRDPVFRS